MEQETDAKVPVCYWKLYECPITDVDLWYPDCEDGEGAEYDASPTECGFNFCPFCGKPVKELIITERSK